MSFSDDFAQALREGGFDVEVASVPPRKALESGLERVRAWIDSLEEDTRSALDEVTAEFPIKRHLADPTVDIAPGLFDLLQAFDSVPASTSITKVLEVCDQALEQVG
jgi:hypothetical protein